MLSTSKTEHNVRMQYKVLIVTLLAAQTLGAGTKLYETGKLSEVAIKDMTTTIPFPTGTGNFSLPLHMGINYQFEISTENNIVYFGSCWSRGKRNYGSDWVVKDPVEFRIDKGKLFLRRPSKSELRLALMGRFRVVSTKAESGADHQSFEPLPPFATKQIEPECH